MKVFVQVLGLTLLIAGVSGAMVWWKDLADPPRPEREWTDLQQEVEALRADLRHRQERDALAAADASSDAPGSSPGQALTGALGAPPVAAAPSAPAVEEALAPLRAELEALRAQVQRLRGVAPAAAPAAPAAFDEQVAASIERLKAAERRQKTEEKKAALLEQARGKIAEYGQKLAFTADEEAALAAVAARHLDRQSELAEMYEGEELNARMKELGNDLWYEFEGVLGPERFDEFWRTRQQDEWRREREVFAKSANKAFDRFAKEQRLPPDQIAQVRDTVARDAERLFTLKEQVRPTRDNSAVEAEMAVVQQELNLSLQESFGPDGARELQKYFQQAEDQHRQDALDKPLKPGK